MGTYGLAPLIMSEVKSNIPKDKSYLFYDTLVVSYSRFEEFRRHILQKPRDERANVIASYCVGHNEVYYADEFGFVTKYLLEGD